MSDLAPIGSSQLPDGLTFADVVTAVLSDPSSPLRVELDHRAANPGRCYSAGEAAALVRAHYAAQETAEPGA